MAGSNTLNNGNAMVSLGVWTPFALAQMQMELDLYTNNRSYSDQPVVDSQGQLVTRSAKTFLRASAVWMKPFLLGSWKMAGELETGNFRR